MKAKSLIVIALLGAVACDKEDPDAALKPKEEVLPNIQVELPAAPNFDEDKAPEKWEDGAYSIYGLRQEMDERIKEGESGTEVLVKGFVQEVYEPPPCPEGQLCAPGKQPHFWITDKPDQQGKKRALMVVSYKFNIPEWEMVDWEGVPQVLVEEGKSYLIKGRFVRFSDTGFADITGGLVDFVAYQAPNAETGQMEWIYPPGSPNHPLTIARQEEQNAKMQEKMAAAAKEKGG
jgi:hypothetical protein